MTAGPAPIDVIAVALRRERQRAGLSAAELARRADIAKSTVSQLESGSGNPSIETLWAISTALGIPFARLVSPPRGGVQLIRAGEGPTVPAAGARYLATLFKPTPLRNKPPVVGSTDAGLRIEVHTHQPSPLHAPPANVFA